jgi:hypothetical protein
MWEELSFYEGFAVMWRAYLQSTSKSGDTCVTSLFQEPSSYQKLFSLIIHSNRRVLGHITHLLALINQFPRVNHSSIAASTPEVPEVDIQRLFRQIRSRYKVLCASLGVRPTLRAAAAADESQADDEGGEGVGPSQPSTSNKGQKTKVWRIDGDRVKVPDEGLNF